MLGEVAAGIAGTLGRGPEGFQTQIKEGHDLLGGGFEGVGTQDHLLQIGDVQLDIGHGRQLLIGFGVKLRGRGSRLGGGRYGGLHGGSAAGAQGNQHGSGHQQGKKSLHGQIVLSVCYFVVQIYTNRGFSESQQNTTECE